MTGLNKKILAAHISNMMIKLKVENTEALIKLLKQMEQ
jgi:DNA-binding CsgD family transcriptional regulator